MKYPVFALLASAVLIAPARSATVAVIPPAGGEQLHYIITWPSGLSLGEALLSGARSQEGPAAHLNLGFHLDASIPGFAVSDSYSSVASTSYCSQSFEKHYRHGARSSNELTTFADGSAHRKTNGGGSSDFSTPSCPMDALSYLFFVSQELSQGRLPADQTVYFGAPYRVQLQFAGAQQIPLGGKNVDADKLHATVTGESAGVQFDMFFLKDQARTLALVRLPLSLGTFSMVLDK